MLEFKSSLARYSHSCLGLPSTLGLSFLLLASFQSPLLASLFLDLPCRSPLSSAQAPVASCALKKGLQAPFNQTLPLFCSHEHRGA